MKEVKLTDIDENIISRYLGYKGNVPDERVVDIIKLCKHEVIMKALPKYTYKVFDIDIQEEKVIVDGTNLILTGKSITRHLTGCDKVVLLCATLGNVIDKYIKMCEIEDLAKALVADATASVAIDSFCDEVEKELKKIYSDRKLTFRFGLGYGDLPLALEPIFLNILNADKTTGVCTNDNYLLSPRKSVACVIGLKKGD